MSPAPTVSVVMPVYNGERHLAAALDSVLAQRGVDAEVVVVDDGSTDGTARVLMRYGAAIRVLARDHRGLAAARNAGLDEARGEYVALFDADDICTPDRLAQQVDVLRTAPEAVLCSSDFSIFNDAGPLSDSGLVRVYSALEIHRGGIEGLYPSVVRSCDLDLAFRVGNIYPALALGNVVQPGTVLFRRSLLKRAGRFDETVGWMCDFVWLCAAGRCGPFAFIPRPLIAYRVSDEQMSSPRNAATRARGRVRALEAIIAADPDLPRQLGRRVYARLAEARLDAAEVLAEESPTESLRLLIRGLLGNTLDPRTPATLAKIMLPRQLSNALRRMFRRRSEGS